MVDCNVVIYTIMLPNKNQYTMAEEYKKGTSERILPKYFPLYLSELQQKHWQFSGSSKEKNSTFSFFNIRKHGS